MKTTRRESLAALLTFGMIGSFPAELLERNELADETDDCDPVDYPEWARLLARLELSANRSLHPGWWRRMHYTGLIRWSDNPSVLVFYGVGRRDQTDEDCCRLLGWIAADYGMDGPAPILGCHRTSCGRSWAVFVHGTCPCFSVGIGNVVPTWKEVYGELLRAWERDHGRQIPRAFLV